MISVVKKFDRIDLTEIRNAAGLSPAQVGWNMKYKGGAEVATNVKNMEKRTDWLASRLAMFIQACGGEADLVVRVNGEELIFPLTNH